MPDPTEQIDPTAPPPVIPLEYASPHTRGRSTRLLGILFSLIFAGPGVAFAGASIALIANAIADGRWREIPLAAFWLAVGGILCGVAWLIQWRWVQA